MSPSTLQWSSPWSRYVQLILTGSIKSCPKPAHQVVSNLRLTCFQASHQATEDAASSHRDNLYLHFPIPKSVPSNFSIPDPFTSSPDIISTQSQPRSNTNCYENETQIEEQRNQRESKQDTRFYVVRAIVPTSTELQRFYYIGE